MNATTQELIAWDRQYLWHPFTPMKPWMERTDILVIERGEGEYLIDTQGRRYIDGVSSLWCNVHGHCVPELDEALRRQLDQIAHTTLLGLANVPSILLAKSLVARAPRGLERVFYSDNGSTAVEVACKMAYQFWVNQGVNRGQAERHRFIAMENSYHGDTLGAVSLGGIPFFHATYKPLCFPTDFLPPPDYRNPDSIGEFLTRMEALILKEPGRHAGIVIEPLIQGAGGMIFHPPGLLRGIRSLCDRHHLLLICDEVMTGFGRTGRMFACEHEGVTPDLLCLSKGLTGGYMPLGVTMTTGAIFDAFYADPKEGKTFFHGHTFTGHPLACAVALASLELFDPPKGSEGPDLLTRVGHKAQILAGYLEPLRGKRFIRDARSLGLVGAIDLVDEQGQAYPYHWRVGGAVCLAMRERGVLLRPLGDVLVIMPPLAIGEGPLHELCRIVLDSLAGIPEILAEKRAEKALV